MKYTNLFILDVADDRDFWASWYVYIFNMKKKTLKRKLPKKRVRLKIIYVFLKEFRNIGSISYHMSKTSSPFYISNCCKK